DVEGFHGDPAVEERRDLGPAVRGDDDLVSEVDERAGGVGADHAQPSGDEDHRTTSKPRVGRGDPQVVGQAGAQLSSTVILELKRPSGIDVKAGSCSSVLRVGE